MNNFVLGEGIRLLAEQLERQGLYVGGSGVPD